MTKKIKNITPDEYLCGPFGGCPSVLEYGSDKLIIVGKKLSYENLKKGIINKIGKNEEAIIIDKYLLKNLQ